jgi:hypothetical protein
MDAETQIRPTRMSPLPSTTLAVSWERLELTSIPLLAWFGKVTGDGNGRSVARRSQALA